MRTLGRVVVSIVSVAGLVAGSVSLAGGQTEPPPAPPATTTTTTTVPPTPVECPTPAVTVTADRRLRVAWTGTTVTGWQHAAVGLTSAWDGVTGWVAHTDTTSPVARTLNAGNLRWVNGQVLYVRLVCGDATGSRVSMFTPATDQLGVAVAALTTRLDQLADENATLTATVDTLRTQLAIADLSALTARIAALENAPAVDLSGEVWECVNEQHRHIFEVVTDDAGVRRVLAHYDEVHFRHGQLHGETGIENLIIDCIDAPTIEVHVADEWRTVPRHFSSGDNTCTVLPAEGVPVVHRTYIDPPRYFSGGNDMDATVTPAWLDAQWGTGGWCATRTVRSDRNRGIRPTEGPLYVRSSQHSHWEEWHPSIGPINLGTLDATS